MCDHSPGQGDEPTEQDKVKLLVPSNPPSLSSAVVTSSLFPVAGNKGFVNITGLLSGARPLTSSRAQEAAAVLDETLSFFVKATGKEEASMRQQLMSKKLDELRRGRELWRTRTEEKHRLQDKKEEAWEFFKSVQQKKEEDFEEEFKRRVMSGDSTTTTAKN